jgi:hypothetical protein
MKSFLEPWHLLLLILAGWINHRQQDAVEYLRTEDQMLKEMPMSVIGEVMTSSPGRCPRLPLQCARPLCRTNWASQLY